ncbi:MAG: VWA domain-containing protein [Actinomycetota bacterium]|nr:VWA domain-containing protein [Actinomycetota bacterium]
MGRRLLVRGFGALLAFSAALAVSALPAFAQTAPAPVTSIRTVDAADFPTVHVTISTPGSTTLSRGDVGLTENGKPVSGLSVQPLSATGQQVDVVLVIDASRSMRGQPLALALKAAGTFLQQLPASVQVGVVTFGQDVRTPVALTADRTKAAKALNFTSTIGVGTKLYDGVASAAGMFSGGGQHNIVLLSDGGDTISTGSQAQAISAAKRVGAQVFAVSLETPASEPKVLKAIASGTNGGFSSSSAAGLQQVYQGLALQISDQYIVTYRSAATAGSQIELSVTAAGGSDSSILVAPKGAGGGQSPAPQQTSQGHPILGGTLGFVVVIVLAFLALFCLAYLLLGTGARARRERELAIRMASAVRPNDPAAKRTGPVAWVPQSMISAAGRVADVGGFGDRLDVQLERAAAPVRAAEFLMGSALAAFAGVILGAVLFRQFILVLVAGVIGAVVPWALVKIAIRRRAAKLHSQLADVLTILASSLRAGHSFMQALDTVAKEIPEPGKTEFGRVVAEIRLGRSVEDALNGMAERVGSYDFKWAVLAVNIQREVGGNLAEILDTVADTVRERDQIRGQVDVLTTEGRMSMYILTGLPIVIALYMILVNREYISLLVTTTPGRFMLIAGVSLLVVGMIWMKKIVKIDV